VSDLYQAESAATMVDDRSAVPPPRAPIGYMCAHCPAKALNAIIIQQTYPAVVAEGSMVCAIPTILTNQKKEEEGG
jgi:hypothetical protein